MKIFLTLLISFVLVSSNLTATETQGTLAVLPFKNLSTKQYNWLSLCFPDSIYNKFSDIKSIKFLERINLDRKKEYQENYERAAKAVGADFLLIGSYQISNNRILIKSRIIHIKDSKIIKRTLQEIEGNIDNLFQLQTRLAKQFAKSTGYLIPYLKLNKDPSQNIKSFEILNKGKIKFHEKEYKKSIELFLEAQEKNEGIFYSEAHFWEGLARTAEAESETKTHLQKVLKENHIKKFKEDADQASHAFFDLGYSYQQQGAYHKAIQAYGDFLTWYDKQKTPFYYKKTGLGDHFNSEISPNLFNHDKRIFYMNSCVCCKRYARNIWKKEKELLYYTQINQNKKEQLICLNGRTNKVVWSSTISDVKNKKARYTLKLEKEKVYLLNENNLRIFNKSTGNLIKHLLIEPSQLDVANNHLILPQLHLDHKSENIIIAYGENDRKSFFEIELKSINLSTGKTNWSKTYENQKRGFTLFKFNEKSYFLNKGKLYHIETQKGILTNLNLLTDNHKRQILQVWPAQDHYLVRTGLSSRNAIQDQYYQWYPQTNKFKLSDKKIFFTFIYNKMFTNYENYNIPIIDDSTGFYSLKPLKWLLPKTYAAGMDYLDRVAGDPDAFDTINQPWVKLEGERLWVWNRNRLIQLLDANDGTLLWRYYLPQSGGGLDAIGNLAFVRIRQNMYCISAQLNKNEYRNLKALQYQAECFEKLKQFKKSESHLKLIIKHDPKNTDGHYLLGKHYIRQKNLTKAAYHFDNVSRFSSKSDPLAQEANLWLLKNVGLRDKIKIDNFKGMALWKEKLLYQDQDDLYLYDPSNKTKTLLYKNIGFWTLANDDILIRIRHDLNLKMINLKSRKIKSLNTNIKHLHPKEANWGFRPQGQATYAPNFQVHKENILLINKNQNRFEIINYKTKKLKWSENLPLHHSFLMTKKHVLLWQLDEDEHYKIICFDIKNGDKIWEIKIPIEDTTHRPIMVNTKNKLFLSFQKRERRERKEQVSIIRWINLKDGNIEYNGKIKYHIEHAYRKNNKFYITVWRHNRSRDTVIMEPNLTVEQIEKSLHGITSGTSGGKKNQFIIGGIGKYKPKIRLYDKNNKQEAISKHLLAVENPNFFNWQKNTISFHSNGQIYILNASTFTNFFKKDGAKK